MFRKLFEPIEIKGMKLKNRIVMAPMGSSFSTEDGFPTEKMKHYYARRAQGGAGLIQVACTHPVFPEGKILRNQLSIDEDRYIPHLAQLVRAIKDAGDGVKVSLQLIHGGAVCRSEITGTMPVGPSEVALYPDRIPRVLSVGEILDFVEAFGEAARRVKEAGFDAVAIQFAHGYLISQFLSPFTNKRTDDYGGNLENRMRFPKEILLRCREKVGKDFPIIIRINCHDFRDYGVDLEEAKLIAKMCEENGSDIVDISGGGGWANQLECDPTSAVPRGVWIKYIEAIKEILNVPVIAVRRIMSPDMAEKILQETKIELIAFGRPLIADPDLPRKAAEGLLEDIIPCTACSQACYDYTLMDMPITCTINPTVGKEEEYRIKPAKNKKKVIIIGGGPGGMEAARVASMRGHEVMLYEKEKKLGGQLNLLCVPESKNEWRNLLNYYNIQLKKARVKIELNKELSVHDLKDMNPDFVIIATGARPYVPPILGIEKKNVLTAWEVLKRNLEVEGKAVIVGGGKVGCEVAEYIADSSNNITVIEMLPDVGLDMGPYVKKYQILRLQAKGISIITNSEVKEITNKSVRFEKDGIIKEVEADIVILATGAKSNTKKIEDLLGQGIPYRAIGDSVKPGDMLRAIHEGFRASLKI